MSKKFEDIKEELDKTASNLSIVGKQFGDLGILLEKIEKTNAAIVVTDDKDTKILEMSSTIAKLEEELRGTKETAEQLNSTILNLRKYTDSKFTDVCESFIPVVTIATKQISKIDLLTQKFEKFTSLEEQVIHFGKVSIDNNITSLYIRGAVEGLAKLVNEKIDREDRLQNMSIWSLVVLRIKRWIGKDVIE